jgi:Mesyanzhinovviridae DNA primase
LRRHPSPPTAIIFSGGGYQALWRLNDVLKVGEDQNIARVESLNKRRIAELGGDPSCFNVDRIMRLPGTVNFPNGRKRNKGRVPALARVVEDDWDRRITPALPAVTEVEEQKPAPLSGASCQIEALPDRCRTAIRTGETNRSGGDRSRAVFAVTCELVRSGWADDAIAALLLASRYAISAHVRAQGKPGKYAGRQIDRAPR